MPELLAELVAKITADATELKKALGESEKGIQDLGKKTDKETKSISQSFQAVGKTFAIVGAAITASMTAIVMSFTKTGSELHDLSLKTGVSVKALAGLKYAAEQNGASLGTVEMAIRRTASAMQQVKDGAAESTRAFARMGLSLEDLEGLNPEEQFLKIASAIAEIPDPMTRAATAQDLFGRSGMDMLPMLSEGAAGLRKMMEEGVKYSGWSTEAAKLADEFGDALGTLKTAMGGLFTTIASSLVPALKDMVSSLTSVVSKIGEWAKANPELSKTLAVITTGAGGVLALTGGVILLLPQITKLIAGFRDIAVASGIAKGAVLGFYGSLLLIPAVVAAVIIGLEYLDSKFDLPGVKGGNTPIDNQIKAYGKLGDSIDATAARAKGYSESVTIFSASDIEAYRKLGYTINEVGVKTAEATAKTEQAKADQTGAITSIKQKIADLKTEYGDLGNAIKSKGDMARAASQVAKDALDSELSKARESANTQIGLLSKIYAEKIRLVNAGANASIKAIQDQIDAIDKANASEDRALQHKMDERREQELRAAKSKAVASGSMEDQYYAERDLADFLAEVKERYSREVEADKKDALRKTIEQIRDETQNKVDALHQELEDKQDNERKILATTEDRIKRENIALDVALKKKLNDLAIELNEKEDNAIKELAVLDKKLADVLQKEKDNYVLRLAEANKFQTQLTNIFGGGGVSGGVGGGTTSPTNYDQLIRTLSTTPWGVVVGAGERATGPGGESFVGSFAEGGIVPGPLGEPQLAIVHGGEPIGENFVGQGGITINFTQPVFFEREDTMNKFVDMIRKGLQRSDRLRFGGAYNG